MSEHDGPLGLTPERAGPYPAPWLEGLTYWDPELRFTPGSAAPTEPAVDRAWRELRAAAANLGTALARFDNARNAYVAARGPLDLGHQEGGRPDVAGRDT